jgi:hypothetical protein
LDRDGLSRNALTASLIRCALPPFISQPYAITTL